MIKKEIQRKRMLTYFIDAAAQIIEEENIDAITIRKVGDIAGYNSATLYNYFESVDHLKLLAAMKFIRPYAEDLPNYISDAKNAYEMNLLIWECFLKHSFKNPEIYYAIFFAKLNNPIYDYVKEYYEIYPQELLKSDEYINTMLLKSNLYDRNATLLEECVSEDLICPEDFPELNEMIMLLFKGMISKIINKEINDPVNIMVERTIKYIKICFQGYLKKNTPSSL